MDKDEAGAQIVLSGSGDFVSLAEAAQYVRDDFPEAHADVVRAETLRVISELVNHGYVQVGGLSGQFDPWNSETAVSEIESRWTEPAGELTPWDGVWLANTPAGDRLADELAGDGRVTKPGR